MTSVAPAFLALSTAAWSGARLILPCSGSRSRQETPESQMRTAPSFSPLGAPEVMPATC